MKQKMYILIVLLLVMIIAGFLVRKNTQAPQLNNVTESQFNGASQQETQPQQIQQVQPQTIDPIEGARARITKKPFGILINPMTSPVQPERFAGYHTGTDLETTPAEQNVDVPVKALCGGKLLAARTASGYGGVAVQACTLNNQAVTVVYGHLKLSSIAAKIGDQLQAGDFLAYLGKGFSVETDGERKHLHLGIHKGSEVNLLGYVQTKNQLASWLDPVQFLGL